MDERAFVCRVVIGGTFAYLVLLTGLISVGIFFKCDLLGPGKELWFFVAGWMTAKSSTIIDNVYGTSTSSEEKTKALIKLANGRKEEDAAN